MLCQASHFLGPAVGARLPIGASQQELLNDLYFRFKEWLDVHRLECSVKRFTMNRIHRESSTHQPMFACKASQCAPLVTWLAELTLARSEVCPGPQKVEAQMVASMCWGLATYFHACKNATLFFTDEEKALVDKAGHTFLYMCSECRRVSISKNTCMFQLVPKFHQYHHIILDVMKDGLNPGIRIASVTKIR
eukprot:5928737-Pyramimonas_sp.AAC.1